MWSHRIADVAKRTVTAAGVGFAMITPAAAILQADDRHAGAGLTRLAPAAHMALIYVFVLPWLGWLLLRLAQVRPAWAVALLGQVLLVAALKMFSRPGGLNFPPWGYGLEGALSYGTAAVIVLVVAALSSSRPSGPGRDIGTERTTGPHGRSGPDA